MTRQQHPMTESKAVTLLTPQKCVWSDGEGTGVVEGEPCLLRQHGRGRPAGRPSPHLLRNLNDEVAEGENAEGHKDQNKAKAHHGLNVKAALPGVVGGALVDMADGGEGAAQQAEALGGGEGVGYRGEQAAWQGSGGNRAEQRALVHGVEGLLRSAGDGRGKGKAEASRGRGAGAYRRRRQCPGRRLWPPASARG